jgi:drug/metabolite transporter (DMT)-like permease
MPMDFARLPVIAIVAMLVYGEPLDPFVLAGAALIFLGNWVNLRNRAV